VTGLQAMLPRWGAVISATTAHINVDEGGAPSASAASRSCRCPPRTASSRPSSSTGRRGWGDEHRAQPLVVSITQSTEVGTLYTADEIRALADHAHERGMKLHLDGARLRTPPPPSTCPARLHARCRWMC
jgi:threonine aldolase